VVTWTVHLSGSFDILFQAKMASEYNIISMKTCNKNLSPFYFLAKITIKISLIIAIIFFSVFIISFGLAAFAIAKIQVDKQRVAQYRSKRKIKAALTAHVEEMHRHKDS
jgi:uncharacterized membrane protein YciS (DUF1049 family)